ncbi:MAG: hypothetical protein IKI75_00455 [Lachnospiraceae bacterium]|nr:hypothetical protein [Lachnospiraceae bacterium]
MITFEEELKKFHRSLELEETESTIYSQDNTDMMDLFMDIAAEKDQEAMSDQGAANGML